MNLFVPLTTTELFDKVSGDELLKIAFGCSTRFITKFQQCHDGMKARVQYNGKYSEPFPVTTGVKQGCVKTPLASASCMFSAMLI